MKLCEYGCKKEAKFPPGKGRSKWCCKERSYKCSQVRKNSIPPFTKEHRQKLRNAKLGISKTEEMKKKMSLSQKFTLKDFQEKHPFFCQIENPIEDSVTGEILIHCKNHECKNSEENGGRFEPGRAELYSRVFALAGSYGYTDNFLYCSDECKQSCIMYGKSAKQLMNEFGDLENKKKKELWYTPAEYNTWRTTVLTRANFLCEYCGRTAEDVHHSRPVKLEPFFALDPDFGISCCEECHYRYGHPAGTECSTGALAVTICTEQ